MARAMYSKSSRDRKSLDIEGAVLQILHVFNSVGQSETPSAVSLSGTDVVCCFRERRSKLRIWLEGGISGFALATVPQEGVEDCFELSGSPFLLNPSA